MERFSTASSSRRKEPPRFTSRTVSPLARQTKFKRKLTDLTHNLNKLMVSTSLKNSPKSHHSSIIPKQTTTSYGQDNHSRTAIPAKTPNSYSSRCIQANVIKYMASQTSGKTLGCQALSTTRNSKTLLVKMEAHSRGITVNLHRIVINLHGASFDKSFRLRIHMILIQRYSIR